MGPSVVYESTVKLHVLSTVLYAGTPRVSSVLGVPESTFCLITLRPSSQFMPRMDSSVVYESTVNIYVKSTFPSAGTHRDLSSLDYAVRHTSEFTVGENVLCDQHKGNLRMKERYDPSAAYRIND